MHHTGLHEIQIPTSLTQSCLYSTPNNTWCKWDVVLCLEYCAFEVVD